MMTGALRFSSWRIGIVGVLVFLVACGPTPAENQLNYASQQCSYGDSYACNQLGNLSYQAQAERQQQDTNTAVAAGLLAVGGVALGAAIADDHGGGHSSYRQDYSRYRGGWGNRGWGNRGWGGGRGHRW